MFKIIKMYIFTIAIVSLSFATVTVHITNPWAKDTLRAKSPVYITSSETGWYPGVLMNADYGNWLDYTFKNMTSTSNDQFQLMSVIPTTNDSYANRLIYNGGGSQMVFKNIFTSHESATEIWITISDTNKSPQVQFISPPYKVFRFYKPWEMGGAIIDIKDVGKYRMKGIGDYCGWLTYKCFTSSKNISVKFTNTLDNTNYTSAGIGDGAYIDLSAAFTNSDTAWILGTAGEKPSVSATFPDVFGDCSPAILGTTLRDINDSTHPDFNKDACNSGTKAFTGMVKKRLGSNGLPVLSDGIFCVKHFDWFSVNNYSKCFNLLLKKNDEGLYEYDTNSFFPLDSFQYLDDAKTILNPNGVLKYGHNYSFTLETGAEFEYVKGQQFYFRGDDDVWVFIDSQLVVDLGGVHYPVEGSVSLDSLGLTPGKTYSFKLFFCERNAPGSSFKMVTSIALRTSSLLFHKDTIISQGMTKYDIYEKITKDSRACAGSNEVTTGTVKATVGFYLEGSSFTTPEKLQAGTTYGGITVSPDFTGVTIDELSITGLTPGSYIIHYYSTKDKTMEGVLKFVVSAKPRITNPVKSAAYFSDNGRGSVNRVEIYFTDTLKALPDSIALSWPSNTDWKMIKDGMALDPSNKRHITVTIKTPFPEEITTYRGSTQLGRCYFYDPSFTLQPLLTVPFAVADSVGPLIKSAVLIERLEPGNDTILITFSEVLDITMLTGKSFTIIKNGQNITLNVLNAFPRGDTLVFVIEDLKERAPVKSDSIALNSEGPIRDVYGNRAHEKNRPVPFITRQISGKVINAYYLDSDADGIVDRAVMTFNKNVVLSDFTVTITWVNALKTAALDHSRFSYVTDSAQVNVNLFNAFVQQPILTSGEMYAYVEFRGMGNSVVRVKDSAAPVLTSAELSPGIPVDGAKAIDKLVCIFSETVNDIKCVNPFLFRRSGLQGKSSDYQISFTSSENNDNKWTFVIDEINGVEFPEDNDSVWISVDCGISDLASNKQLNTKNHRVLLKVNAIPVNFDDIKYGPNPIHQGGVDSVVVIKINPSIKLKQYVKYQVDFLVFDNLGNVIYKNRLDSQTSPTAALSCKWNGRNEKGRLVGRGTYVAIIKLHDLLNETTIVKSIKIGVE